jgi:hypothetical protein
MIIYFVIILAIITRFIPHMPNAAPITALAIFSAAYLPWQKSVGITLAVRFVSDIFLGFFAWPLMVAVYASHLTGILFGLWVRRSAGPRPALKAGQGPALQKQAINRWGRIIISSLSASVIFFLVTNFAFLYANYPHNLSGIIQSYANGLPFFRGTVVGDLGYSVALFGGYQLVKFFVSRYQLVRLS